MRQYLGLIAGCVLFVMGTAFFLSPSTRVYGFIVVVSGIVGIWYGIVTIRQSRLDRYDLSKLFEGDPMPEGGEETLPNKSGYCTVCGAFISSPYKPCTKCGAAL